MLSRRIINTPRGGPPRLRFTLALILCAIVLPAESYEQQIKSRGHYLFAWAGDVAHKGNDFLPVIDADPASESCERLNV